MLYYIQMNELYAVLNECHEPFVFFLTGMLEKGAFAASTTCWMPEVACVPATAPSLHVDHLSTSVDLPPLSVAFAFVVLLPATFFLLFERPAGAAVVVTHQHKIKNNSRMLTSFLGILPFLPFLDLCGYNAQTRST